MKGRPVKGQGLTEGRGLTEGPESDGGNHPSKSRT